MKTRREFIKTASAVAVLGIIPNLTQCAMDEHKYIGIQLYTIREKLKEDFLATMKRISLIGFNAIETAGYSNRKFYGYQPVDFRKFSDDLGLKALSSHANVQWDNLEQTIEDTLNAGMEYLVKPSVGSDLRKTIDDYKKLAELFNKIGEKCTASGLKFAYHNHAFEFEMTEGEIPYDVLLNNTEKELVTMQLDTYWMVYGGHQPMAYFDKYPGRFELLHIKDMDDTEKRASTEIGNGIIDFAEIFDAKSKSGMKYFFLEQEAFEMDAFESLEISYKYLKKV